MDTFTPNTKSFPLVVRDREKILFQGDAKALTSLNDRGEFDVLPEHTNFISVIREKITVHKTDGGHEDFTIDHGVVKVYMGQAAVYLGFLPLPENEAS